MSERPRFTVGLLVLAPTVCLAVGSACFSPAALVGLHTTAYEALTRSVPSVPPDRRVVIVDVDERSLAAVGQWPWRRDTVGRLIDRLRSLGASVVALDMVFAEADRASDASGDQRLADSLRRGRTVLGYALTFDPEPPAERPCLAHPMGLALVGREREADLEPFFRATGALCSIAPLSAAAPAAGFLNATPDADGILRRVPLVAALGDRIYPALALAAVTALTGEQPVTLRSLNADASMLLSDEPETPGIPLDGKGNLLLRYRGGQGTFRYVSASDVLGGAVPADLFDGALVFVGTTALGTRDVVSTPHGTQFSGVEIQATVADNLLRKDFFYRSPYAALLEPLLVLALGGMVAVLAVRRRLAWATIGAALALAGLWVAAYWLLSQRGVFLSPVLPSIGIVAPLAVAVVAWRDLERRRANRAEVAVSTSQRLMVQSLLSLTSVRDSVTGDHARRTRRYAKVIAAQLARHESFRDYLTADTVELLSSLAPLHDIGKVGIPDRVLNKDGALTGEELEEMRRHPAYGLAVIEEAQRDARAPDDATLTLAKDIVYTHHEQWDGTGYPRGLRGDEIPIAGRVIALVDVYDALRTERPYRQAMRHEDVVALIASRRGTHFDPDVVDAFLAVSEELLRLSNEEAGMLRAVSVRRA